MIRSIIPSVILMITSLSGVSAGTEMASENPVLLVHGLWDSPHSMKQLGSYLEKEGRRVSYATLTPNNGSQKLEILANQLRQRAMELYGSQRFDLVAFSMGGLVSRYYIEILEGHEKVSHFVSVSSPNHGTFTAYLSHKPGAIQMRPNSAFLKTLDKNTAKLHGVQCTSIYTPLDLMIIPASSSRLPFAKNLIVWSLAHPLMLYSRTCFRVINEHLSRK